MKGQTSLLEEIIVDNFAGGGGASTGIELATGRPVSIAINHDPAAILMHKTNHPYTLHLQASVWDVDPIEVCAGRPVGLAWFSPDCKHFSKAKGAALVDRNIRGLAWIVLRWAGTVRPRVIILENVEEFKTWGPVRRGKPIKNKSGQTFEKWKQQLSDLGYNIEYRELVAADYGTPTTRKRLVLIARCDDRPIVWPERTHAPRDSEEVKSGKLRPWRSAAEIIDWSLPMYSIFASKAELKEKYGVNAVRPLADNTLRRVIRGVDKFTIKSGRPFIVECNHSGNGHVRSTADPINTITGKYTGGICNPALAPFTFGNTTGSAGAPVNEPVHTVTSAGNQVLCTPVIVPFTFSNTGGSVGTPANQPVHTIRTAGGQVLAAANLVEYYGNGNPLKVDQPLHTVTARDREAVVAAHITKFKGQNIGQSIGNQPLQTCTTSAGQFALIGTKIEKYEAGADLGYWPAIRVLLNKYCGYDLKDDEVLLLNIGGVDCFICNIFMRMLVPPELYAAMGFPADYIIDRDYMGNEYKKTQQVARCGNAVCPQMATAVVRANMPEWCQKEIWTMSQLCDVIAV